MHFAQLRQQQPSTSPPSSSSRVETLKNGHKGKNLSLFILFLLLSISMPLSFYFSIYLSISLPLSLYLFILSLSISLSYFLSLYLYLTSPPFYLSTSISLPLSYLSSFLSLYLYLSIYLSIYLPLSFYLLILSLYIFLLLLSISQSMNLPFYLSTFLSIYLSIHPSINFYLSYIKSDNLASDVIASMFMEVYLTVCLQISATLTLFLSLLSRILSFYMYICYSRYRLLFLFMCPFISFPFISKRPNLVNLRWLNKQWMLQRMRSRGWQFSTDQNHFKHKNLHSFSLSLSHEHISSLSLSLFLKSATLLSILILFKNQRLWWKVWRRERGKDILGWVGLKYSLSYRVLPFSTLQHTLEYFWNQLLLFTKKKKKNLFVHWCIIFNRFNKKAIL